LLDSKERKLIQLKKQHNVREYFSLKWTLNLCRISKRSWILFEMAIGPVYWKLKKPKGNGWTQQLPQCEQQLQRNKGICWCDEIIVHVQCAWKFNHTKGNYPRLWIFKWLWKGN
jgi:hypothetical protein